jgi:Icc-related predicted phosphoesterase
VTEGGQSGRNGREVRVAAMADLHADENSRGKLAATLSRAAREADFLLFCGDLTTHGRPEQMEIFIEETAGVDVPMIAVLGNHDYEAGEVDVITHMLRAAGVRVLQGEHVVLDGVGFVGVKGFAGGFDRGALGPFGEPLIKQFVQAALDEALSLETALRTLGTELKIVLMHYAPIQDTVLGEPEMIYPFLGSSRLLTPIETYGASVVFHGHAHHGTLEGRTPSGVPVYNVASSLLQDREDVAFRIWHARAEERRNR